jgi:glycosyltransferase involved in cell wall biosynthesis
VSAQPTLDFVLPGDPQTLTGGYIYDRHILEGLDALGWHTQLHALDPSFPFPTAAALAAADATLAKIADGRRVVIDGLALGAMPELIARHAPRLKLVALIHHPLAGETGLSERDRASLAESEREALAHVSRVIVTSRWTKRRLIEEGVRSARIGIVMPGTERAPLARGSGGDAVKLLCVATLTPRKGHAVLFDALARLRGHPWELDCVGSLERDPVTADALRRQLERLGLTGRVRLLGEVPPETLEACYAGADLFVVASYLEGYGMAHSEALARGLPLVTTTAGAIADTVPADAAVLVPPGDRGALARALAEVIDDAARRAALAQGALHARERLPTWAEASTRFAAELESLA